jgi:Tol biopolymer transport system component
VTPERIGPYPIEKELGRGGMGVVYLGRDTRLDRRVAIKVLPEAFAHDPERLARFEREARLVASLNHPNIAGIYGIEEDAGQRFLALEYVEGETLAERIDRGPLPLEEALDVGRQVTAALEAAHDGGVVHRDLKPANIKVTPSGEVKVLDFGLAKGGLGAGLESASDLSNSPTLTRAMTGAGMILGTAAYMSPEQARGRSVDKRADIWAFGCLLYECLTGRQAFAGETVSDMIARILQGEPEWNALPARTPERVRGLLRRCLEKDAKRRLRDIGDARMEIEDVQAMRTSSSTLAAASQPAGGTRRLVEWGRLAVVAVVAAAASWFAARSAVPPAPVRHPARFTIQEPDGVAMSQDGAAPAMSPDGLSIAFVATDSIGQGCVWLRPLNSTKARRIAGAETEDDLIIWSPDSRQVAFVNQGKLKRVAVAGGDPEVICPINAFRGGSWNREDVILLAPSSNDRIYRVPAGGGDPVPVTTLDSTRAETAHRFPQFLSDGRHFLYTALPARDGRFDTWVGSLDSPKRQLLLSAGTGVTWAPPGHLLYERADKLVAQGFDPKGMRLRGDPKSLGDVVAPTNRSGGPIASASATGAIAYVTYQAPNGRLAWVTSAGVEVASIPLPPGPYSLGSLSPDDRRLALVRFESPNIADVWIAELERGVATRFTDEPGANEAPKWSPDGTRIAWAWSNGTPQQFRIKSLAGGSVESLLDGDPFFKHLYGWTPDGRSLLYARLDPVTRWDLWVLPLDGDRKPRPYLQTRFNETEAQVSPDGRWLTYNSDESGQIEAYVQSFPDAGGKYQVTTGGGRNFGWSPDGQRLYFGLNSEPTRGFEAEILDGPEFRLGPSRHFATVPKGVLGVQPANTGSRFVALLAVGAEPKASLTVLLDGLPGPR